MIQTITDYIVAALREAFPDVADIFIEQIKQGLTEPCFFIKCVNPSSQIFLKNKYYLTNLFSVQYFAESKTDANAECYSVCSKLFDVLEIIGAKGGLIRGRSMSGNIFDGVLTFTVSYNVFVKHYEDIEKMEVLEIKQNIKGVN